MMGTPDTAPSNAEPSRDDLRTALQALAARLGKTPTVVDMHENGNYHPEQYVDAFGGWGRALDAAGLDPGDSATKIPDYELLAELQRLYVDLERSPSQQDMRKHGSYSDQLYKNRFGSWNQALQAAMLDTNPVSNEIPETELLAELKGLAEELGKIPTPDEMAEQGAYSPATYHRRFGSWRQALAAVKPSR